MNTTTTHRIMTTMLVTGSLFGASMAFAGGTLEVPGPLNLTIQEAINIAPSLGATELIVAPGTYVENINLNGLAITLRSSGGAAVTTIDGDAAGPTVLFTEDEGPDTVLEGFTITNGATVSTGGNNRGGGLDIEVASPTIRDCVIMGNNAAIGGGFYSNESSTQFISCVFENNTADRGGAYYSNNSPLTFIDCVIRNNDAIDTAGGGGWISASTNTYMNCLWEGNSCKDNGGALYLTGGTSVTVTDSVFNGNIATDDASAGRGGALYAATGATFVARNCVFENNFVNQFGGALYNSSSTVTVQQCTFYNNQTGTDLEGVTAGSACTLDNCIAWNNTSLPINPSASPDTVRYSIMQFGAPGAGNLDVDPLFVDAANGNYRLMMDSPAIDAGNATLLPSSLATDFEGQLRAINGSTTEGGPTGVPFLGVYVDMGAFEFQPIGVPSSCPSDIAPPGGNNVVNIDDLLAVINAFGACP